jgi:hypothetical protein
VRALVAVGARAVVAGDVVPPPVSEVRPRLTPRLSTRLVEGTYLYEIDQPQVLALKQSVFGEAGALAGCEQFAVPIDLRDLARKTGRPGRLPDRSITADRDDLMELTPRTHYGGWPGHIRPGRTSLALRIGALVVDSLPPWAR